MSKKPTEIKEDEVETTGHVWDGIEEFNNPLPRWWLWTLYATIVWAIGYTIAYPAWPISKEGATPGLLKWSTRADVAAEIKAVDEANAAIENKLASVELTEIAADPELKGYAINAGHAVFQTWCAQCHGSGASGAKGYPNLLDDDWLWGGTVEDIHYTVTHGVRNEDDDDARFSEMPKFGADELLSKEEIEQVVNYVLTISGQTDQADPELAKAGAVVFEDNCSSCHGEDGKGDRDQGAPNLTDAIWLYGGDKDTIRESVNFARFGVMPTWAARLSESDIRAVATYVHQLGGGE
ncbi:cytochrome-c oxidase, cbb3-type subunit III [Profundibacter amoris]|uniref:Cbb3-type cytochrome c oxidase subunit n=1 Tax=Profundibacter amoris TaxID=2171755 RepID=A0A347UJD3_9RHOB|nr:cytochrome-c oxidase, cbb3-type subunit III [Profundibacter amoris]AXX98961.1 cytochrome-c oxidase, cbb3-type subunit III [Profundibacter amoris]